MISMAKQWLVEQVEAGVSGRFGPPPGGGRQDLLLHLHPMEPWQQTP